MAPTSQYQHKAIEGNFIRFLVSMPPMPSFPTSAVHEMRVRRNAPKIPSEKDSRSIFIKNMPVDSNEAYFRALFIQLVGPGCFESISFRDENDPEPEVEPAQAKKIASFNKKRRHNQDEEDTQTAEEEQAKLPQLWTRRIHQSGSAAVVLLADEHNVRIALKKMAKTQSGKNLPVWGDGVSSGTEPLGPIWVMEHLQLCRPDREEMQGSVHAFFNVYNRKEKEAAEMAKRMRNEPDEDGFVTVTRGSRAAPASRSEAEAARKRMMAKEAKKKEEMVGFYRFQMRERRKAEQQALIKRFEGDRKRVEALREKRGKFRPEH
ncbi:Ribosomal RNA-processing protein 7 A [Ceratocystis pirilliformis]|uniref:Ribosomal RNA-processing protein 7 A n=1 Tax=Ceratocystis pirilliformis TaxID=259994 RepID=A0ABR3YLP3_9PEZI